MLLLLLAAAPLAPVQGDLDASIYSVMEQPADIRGWAPLARALGSLFPNGLPRSGSIDKVRIAIQQTRRTWLDDGVKLEDTFAIDQLPGSPTALRVRLYYLTQEAAGAATILLWNSAGKTKSQVLHAQPFGARTLAGPAIIRGDTVYVAGIYENGSNYPGAGAEIWKLRSSNWVRVQSAETDVEC